ncbi:MAG: SprT family zinc-dependent metalloprotease [Usitatibacter sp.]
MASRDLLTRDARQMALSAGPIDYVLVRRRGRRGVGLKVDESGLTVSAPVTMPVSRIEAVARESESWIVRKIAEWSARQVPDARWDDGAALHFLGELVTLRLVPGKRSQVLLASGELRVATRGGGEEEIRRAVVRWYKRAAHEWLAGRTRNLALRAGLVPPNLMISSALSRWGSCNTRGEVRLAWRLVKAPQHLIDYVICHELAHLRHMNHSAAFWAEVERQCPGYKSLRAELFSTDHLYRAF